MVCCTHGEAAILRGAHARVAVVGEGLGDVRPRPGELLGQGLHCRRVLHWALWGVAASLGTRGSQGQNIGHDVSPSHIPSFPECYNNQ